MNKILDMFREYKNEPKSHFLANYFISIIENITQFNYSSINFVLNLLNNLPETLLVIMGPVIVGFLSFFIFILDHFYLFYLWFSSMSWFFKKNKNDSETGIPKWENISVMNIMDYICALLLVMAFISIFFFLYPCISVLAFLSLAWCAMSCLSYKAELNGKPITVLAVVQDVFKYYKNLIMGILCFFVVSTALSKLGTTSGIFSIITLLLIYFGIIAIDIFKPVNEENLTPLTSFNMAKKTCSNIKETVGSKHGLLYNMIFGQKGGNITKELKNIGKKLGK
jgi:hypothetical protein